MVCDSCDAESSSELEVETRQLPPTTRGNGREADLCSECWAPVEELLERIGRKYRRT